MERLTTGRRPLLLHLLIALALAAPGGAARGQADLLGGGAAPAVPEAEPLPIAAGDGVPADGEIEARLRGILSAVEELSDVTADVRSGVVELGGSTPDAAAAGEAVALARRIEGVATVVDRIERSAALDRSLAPGIGRFERRLTNALRLLPLVGVAILVFAAVALAGWLVARWRWLFRRLAPNRFVAELAAQAVRIAFVIAGLVVALDLAGATALLGAILGAAGILGLALGFAVRDTIENYVASVLLSVRQPFAPNDLVEIEGEEGFVVRLTSRATVLLTLEGNHVRIPNATVFKSRIVNYTHNPERRFDFALGVNGDADLGEAIALGVGTLDALAFTLAEPRVGAWIEAVGDSSVLIRFVGWIDQRGTDFLQARSEAIRLVKRALEGAGFELPEPIYRVRMQEPSPERPRPPALGPGVAADTARLGSVERRAAEERARERGDLLGDRGLPE